MAAVLTDNKIIKRVLTRTGNPPKHTQIKLFKIGERTYRINFVKRGEWGSAKVLKSWFLRLTDAGHVHVDPAIPTKVWTDNPYPTGLKD
jgi:hypothetical protein